MREIARQVSSSGTDNPTTSRPSNSAVPSTATDGSNASSVAANTSTSSETLQSTQTASTITTGNADTTTTSPPDSTVTTPPPISFSTGTLSTTFTTESLTTDSSTILVLSSTTTSTSSTSSSPSSRRPSSTTSSTTSYTTMTTALSGQLTTITSPLPTSLSSSVPTNASPNRTAIIAGSTAAAAVLIFLLLAGVFLHHRRKLRQRQALASRFDQNHVGPREGRGLLQGEDFDDEDSQPMTMHSYRDSVHTVSMVGASYPQSPSPSLYRSRASESGSIFREEEVWPPPAEFVDPFLSSVRRNQEVDLGRIVDEVMGPRVGHTPTASSSSRNDLESVSPYRTHRASDSATSYTGLLDKHRRSHGSSVSLYTDPYSTSRDSMVQNGAAKSNIIHITLPPGRTLDLGFDPMTIAPGAYSLQLPAKSLQRPVVSVLPGHGVSRPKMSSPLARAISNASIKMGDKTRLWLERKVRRGPVESGSAGADEAL